MKQRGKNTNNTLVELKNVLASIKAGTHSADGCSDMIKDIKEDIAQLESQLTLLEKAAGDYVAKYGVGNALLRINAFEAGAEWQKEQYKTIKDALGYGLTYMKLYMQCKGMNVNAPVVPGSNMDKVLKAIEQLQD